MMTKEEIVQAIKYRIVIDEEFSINTFEYVQSFELNNSNLYIAWNLEKKSHLFKDSKYYVEYFTGDEWCKDGVNIDYRGRNDGDGDLICGYKTLEEAIERLNEIKEKAKKKENYEFKVIYYEPDEY